jgi:hypothetical protein
MTQRDAHTAPELTQDEVTILDLLTAGLGKPEIANLLHIDNMRAVERQLDRITEKFSVIDGRLGRVKGQTGGVGEIGYVGRIATIIRIYREYYIEKKSDPQPLFYVRRRDVRFEMDITEDHISIEAEVRIQSLRDQLAFVAHGLILEDQSPQADARHQHLEASTMAQGVIVTSEIAINDPKTPRFRIRFEPPLKLGQEISYHYSIKSANYFPMSLGEIKKRKVGGYYHLDEGVCETTYTISTPTDHLTLQLTFPPLVSHNKSTRQSRSWS